MKHHYILHSITFLFLGIWCMSASAQISKNCDFSQMQTQYSDTLINGTLYRTYTIEGLEMLNIPGSPQLPCKLYRFSVPYNATQLTLSTIVRSNTENLQKRTLMPALYPKEICDTTPVQIIADSTVYLTNAYFPSEPAEVFSDGFYQGENRIVTVAVYPMQFNPVTKNIKRNQTVNLTLSYGLGNDTLSNVIVRDNIVLRQQAWDDVKAIVDNPSQVESFAPNETAVQNIHIHYFPDSLQMQVDDPTINEAGIMSTSDCEYMIVTTQIMAQSFRRLAAFKRQKGYTVGIKSIEDILTNPLVQNGDTILNRQQAINDSIGKLRQYVRLSWMSNSTKYLLLGGKPSSYIPVRFAKTLNNMDYTVPTDAYLSCLSDVWQLNSDNQYYLNQSSLFCPNLYVGRLSAKKSEEIKNYTDKLIQYEMKPGKGDFDYLRRALYTQSAQMDDYSYAYICADSLINIYPSYGIIQEIDREHPTGNEVITQIRETKYGFLNFHAHGEPFGIEVNHKRKIDPITNQSTHRALAIMAKDNYTQHMTEEGNGIDNMGNEAYPNVFYSMACTTMPYDGYRNLNNEYTMGESFMLCNGYGGPAFLGNTRDGFVISSFVLEKRFINELNKGNFKLGIAEAMSKYHFNENNDYNRHVALTHNLLGDPEFELWTNEPASYTGINVSRSDNSITVSGISADSTIVAICDNDGNAIRKYSVNGSVTFSDVSPNSTIMVYKHNYLPYIAPMFVQNTDIENSQYVFASQAFIGRDVDSNRTIGDVTIPFGVNYEMEFTDSVNITGGFEVEKGAEFTVMLSDY